MALDPFELLVAAKVVNPVDVDRLGDPNAASEAKKINSGSDDDPVVMFAVAGLLLVAPVISALLAIGVTVEFPYSCTTST
jgi:hypothetical protein